MRSSTCTDRQRRASSSDPESPRESQAPRQTIVTADYRFENSLADSVGAATELSAIGAHATGFVDEAVLGRARPVLTFDRGSGLELTPASAAIGRPTPVAQGAADEPGEFA